MRIDPPFPPSRADLPSRRAEHTIYQVLADTCLPGRALYEARTAPDAREVDFLVWLESTGRYAIEVKGGRYVFGNRQWYVITGRGRYRKPSPVHQVREAAMTIPAAIRERLHRSVSVLPVLAFPDMPPDPVMADYAARHNVGAIFGADEWVQGLVALAQDHPDILPPNPGQVDEEVMVVMPDLVAQRDGAR